MIKKLEDEAVRLTLCLVLEEMVYFAGRSVVCHDVEAFVVHVQDQVLALRTGIG